MHLMTYAQLVLFIVDNGFKVIIFYSPFFPQLLFLLLYSHVHLFSFSNYSMFYLSLLFTFHSGTNIEFLHHFPRS